MGFEHVGLQQGVMNDTVQRDAMIRKDVLVVLEVLPQFRPGVILQPRLELPEHKINRQLRWGTRITVRQRHVSRTTRLHGKGDADQSRFHRVQVKSSRYQAKPVTLHSDVRSIVPTRIPVSIV